MKWSIMILTQPSRSEYLCELLYTLKPQIEEHSSEVDLNIRVFKSGEHVGDVRQCMREDAKGEYSNFLDDDDLVTDTYIADLLPLMDGVDFVGHKLRRFDDGTVTGDYKHSLAYSGSNSPHSTPHINPIKTSVALKVPMHGDYGEDRRWWDSLMENGLVKTENYLDRVEYFYRYRSNKSDGVVTS